jgi:polar amino acid transport system permease protein
MELLLQYAPAFARGLGVTVLLTLIVWIGGIAGGVAVGALASRRRRPFMLVVRLVALVVGAIPVLVLLMWLHYPAQALLQIVVDPFITTALALTLINVVFVADTVSRTIDALPSEWALAARSSGLSEVDTLKYITLPLSLRQLIGPIVLIQIYMLHCTIFGSLISVQEIFRTIQTINSIEYRPVELYSFLVIFFLLVCGPLHIIANFAAKKYSKDLAVK